MHFSLQHEQAKRGSNFYFFNDRSSKYLNSAGDWSSQRSEGGECTAAEFPKESDKRNGSNCSLIFFLIEYLKMVPLVDCRGGSKIKTKC